MKWKKVRFGKNVYLSLLEFFLRVTNGKRHHCMLQAEGKLAHRSSAPFADFLTQCCSLASPFMYKRVFS